MILDTLPNQYEVIAQKYTFRPWQTGLLANMLQGKSEGRFLNINMGRLAGHTYFTRVVAGSEFPAHTKIYLTRQEHLSAFSSLLFNEDRVHEPIELLGNMGSFPDRAEFVIIDMSDEHARRFKAPIDHLVDIMPDSARLVLLQANFLDF